MKLKEKKSFFEKLTGTINVSDDDFEEEEIIEEKDWVEENEEDGQLTIDVHQTNDDIIVQTMVAGVRPEDLDVTITRDVVTIKGTRKKTNTVSEEDYFYKELYWGTFSRIVSLPQEIDPEESEATEKNGLLTLRLPKIDKEKKRNIKVTSS
ncbi:MAG TPA: Hsp20/alpha crystallin family protein [Candidatus Yonathbacteria bacterium]|nr:Hsp20/alpha crystallin family protein [Candidatus Yonathbacteria bacterium]